MEHLLQCSEILCWLQLQYLLEAWENYCNFHLEGRIILNAELSFLYPQIYSLHTPIFFRK